MKGLLKKDLYIIKNSYGKNPLFLLAAVIGILLLTTDSSLSFISAWLIILFAITAISAMGYDDAAGWNAYALTMPVSKKALAGCKYLFALIMIFCATVLSFLFMAAASFQNGASLQEFLPSIMLGLTFGILGLSILIPVNYKFGTEKGRVALIFIAFLPALISLVIGKLKLLSHPILQAALKECMLFINRYQLLLPWAGLLLLAAIMALSYMLSVKILSKKEF